MPVFPRTATIKFVVMRAWNRAKLLWGYLRHKSSMNALPVEYIVETTAKCNLYCPMCPRETHKQPKEDMTEEIFQRLVRESGAPSEHMMLIGLDEPFMDPKIFERIEYCERHNTSTLLSTNGTFLDEKMAGRLLATPLQHITLSFDGATKESFEFYRKGARFEKVRDNFVRFARLKKERGSGMQVVVQMVRMERNAGEGDSFKRCCTTIPHPALVAGSLIFHGKTVRRLLPIVERLAYFSKAPKKLLNPPKLVQVSVATPKETTPRADS